MTYHEELATARQHLALAMTFTDNNPLKATVINSAKASIAHCEAQIAWNEQRNRAASELAASIAAYKALPFFKRIFARNPSH